MTSLLSKNDGEQEWMNRRKIMLSYDDVPRDKLKTLSNGSRSTYSWSTDMGKNVGRIVV